MSGIVFSLNERRPEGPAPHWSDANVDALIPVLDGPFNSRIVLQAMARLALQIGSGLERYELVVGEGKSARWPADVFTALAGVRRAAAGLPGVHTGNIDGHHGLWQWAPPNDFYGQSEVGGRALLLTDYIFTGGSIRAAYGALSEFRPLATVDVAAVGMCCHEEGRKRYWWLRDGSQAFRVPGTSDGVDTVLLGTQFSDAIDPERYATNTAITATALQSILLEAQARGEFV